MITVAQLGFQARLRPYIDKQQAKWEAEDARRGWPPSQQVLDGRWLWEARVEETEWERFYGLLEADD